MALPITVPYTFGNATTAIPLSNLDSDYATVYQAVNGIGNGSVALANVAITGGTISGNTTASNVTVSSGTFTNVTLSNVTISSVSTPITAAEGGTGSSSAFTTNGVVYASSTSALATGSALVFDGNNLGLGVTPSAWLTGSSFGAFQMRGVSLFGNASSAGGYLFGNAYIDSGGTIRYVATGTASGYNFQGGAHAWNIAPSGTAGNAISFTQAMTLNAAGNLLVGTTSNVVAGAGHFSRFNADLTYQFGVGVSTTQTTGGSYFVNFVYNGSQIGSITTAAGTVTLYNTTSDQRLKENIVDAPDFGSVIDSIQVRSFDWKANNEHQRAGFIAQELVIVAPEAVHQPTDTEQMMAVDYSKLVPMLVKEIQSLRKRILTLENK